jgi:hypothetical protein
MCNSIGRRVKEVTDRITAKDYTIKTASPTGITRITIHGQITASRIKRPIGVAVIIIKIGVLTAGTGSRPEIIIATGETQLRKDPAISGRNTLLGHRT